MFKKSRIKIIISIMSVLVLLLAGTVCVIYFSSYLDLYNRSQDMLESYTERYSVDGMLDEGFEFRKDPDFQKGDDPMMKKGEPEHIFQVSVFYSVAFSEDGGVLRVDDNGGALYSQDELVRLAGSVIEKGKTQGSCSSLFYKVKDLDNFVLVAFMDKAVVDKNITTLLKYTILFGAFAFVAIFFLSLILSRRIVEPLEKTYEKQKQFISDAGHELKTPVSVIGANADMLFREIGENQWLSNIQYENGKMAGLIKQLMELARTENVTPVRERVDFSRLVTGELLSFESVAYEKGAELDYKAVEDGVTVNGSFSELSQLVSILIDNAVNHSAEHSTVTVALSSKHGKARLSVKNAGGEIPKEQEALIFERFYRGDYSRSDNGNHYGLGLAIAKAIVKSHHGDISVSSENGYVTFSVSLPI